MKQFIYLDTDMVNSIIAQKDKGLVLETASEQENTSGKEHTTTGTLAANGSASGGIWKFAQAQAELSGSVELSANKHSQTVLKEIATKTLHDAAFDIAYAQISKEYDTNPNDADLGSFVELSQVFEFVDLVYMESLFSEDGFISFVKKADNEKIEKLARAEFQKLGREEQRKGEGELKKQIKKLIEENDKQYENIVEAIRAIRHMIPYNRLLVSHDGYVIPLEDKYFRDNPETMGFKHGGYITCVGYITNVIGESSEYATNSIFSQIQTMVNQTLISILPTKEKDLFIVHPIAIYYGQ